MLQVRVGILDTRLSTPLLWGICASLVVWNAQRRGKDVRKRLVILMGVLLFLLVGQMGFVAGIFVPILALWMGSAFLVAWVAEQKGRNFANWFLIGMAFGVFGLIALAALPNAKRS